MKEKHKIAHMIAAFVYANMSYAKRKQVGCVIVKNDNIISIGYNGTPSGWDNVCEDPVTGLTKPEVSHAEHNAIQKLAKDSGGAKDASIFITTSPCIQCATQIADCGITSVYHEEIYRNAEGRVYIEGLDYLKKRGVYTEVLSIPQDIKDSIHLFLSAVLKRNTQ
jgi:dCMP deaminase